jgi:hypothetical protein
MTCQTSASDLFRPEHPVETVRLTLRPFTSDDFDDLYAYQSRPEVARYLHWDARDHAQVREALVRQCGETSLSTAGDWLTFAVVWRAAGEVVGEVGLKLISWENRRGEIGFASCTIRSSRDSGQTSSYTPSSIMSGEHKRSPADLKCLPKSPYSSYLSRMSSASTRSRMSPRSFRLSRIPFTECLMVRIESSGISGESPRASFCFHPARRAWIA